MLRVLAPVLFSASLAAGAFAAPGDGSVPPEKKLPLKDRDAFAFTILDEQGVAEHPLSGLVCPFEISGHQLTGLAQYSLSGHDVSCGYNAPEGGSTLTFYFSHYGEQETAERTVEGALAAIRNHGNFGPPLEQKQASMNFGGGPFENCQMAVLDNNPPAVMAKSGVWACNIDGWVYKVRATWTAVDAVMLNGIEEFSAGQVRARDFAAACAALDADDTPFVETVEESTVVLASVVTLASDRLEDVDDQNGPDDPTSCHMGGWSNDATATTVVAYPRSTTPALQTIHSSLDGIYQQGGVMLVPAPSLNSLITQAGTTLPDTGAWMLRANLSDSAIGVFRIYAGRPPLDQALEDLQAVLREELQALTSIEYDEDGNTSINFDPGD